MTAYWRFHGIPKNIERAFEHLLWGFHSAEEAGRRGYDFDRFMKLYLQISPGDLAFITHSERGVTTMALGRVEDTYYDDKRMIWDDELKQGRVLYPFRVSFEWMMYGKMSVSIGMKKEDYTEYIEGFGLGLIDEGQAKWMISKIRGQYFSLKLKLPTGDVITITGPFRGVIV